MKQSVCLVVKNSDGLYLGVTRKNDTTKWGLPGGKVDEGETPSEAIIRETLEETGLHITTCLQIDVRNYGGYEVFLYVGEVAGNISTKEAGLVDWIDKEKLFSGPFGDYNLEVFTEFKL